MTLNYADIIPMAEAAAEKELKILVCGSRDFNKGAYSKKQVFDTLDELRRTRFAHNELTVINGWANGADLAGAEWAENNNLPFLSVPADWGQYGKLAGFYRNEVMLTKGKPDVVIAFPGNEGTKDMIARTKRRNIELIEIKYE